MNDVAIAERPVNQLAERSIGIGHNQPPIVEQLGEELATDKTRADELVEAATAARIANDEDAAKVTLLIGLLRSHEKAVDGRREVRKQPHLEAGRTVDAAYGAVIRPMVTARGSLTSILTVWQRRREEEARQERQRVEAEQRRQAQEAERARAAADAAQAEGRATVAAELTAIRAEEEARRLAKLANTIRPEPIRTAVGAVAMRREIAFEVDDLRKALGWLAKNRTNEIAQAARTILGKHLASLGVDAVQAGVEIPGVTARIESRAQVR